MQLDWFPQSGKEIFFKCLVKNILNNIIHHLFPYFFV